MAISHVTAGSAATAAAQNALIDVVNDHITALAAIPVTLVGQADGSSSTGSAHNLATQAISGLTIKDELEIRYWLKAGAAGGVTYPQLYDTGTGATLSMMAADASETPTSIAANDVINGVIRLRCHPNTNTTYYAQRRGHTNTTDRQGNNPVTGLTAWTGSWTMSFRVDAASATTYFAWAIYKIAGQ